MALFGRGYDRDYDQAYRSNTARPRGPWNRSPDWFEPGYDGERGSQDRFAERSRPYPIDARSDYDRHFGRGGYGRDFKSQWQTDYGDPYGDRIQQTPIRVIRGEGRGYDRGLFSGGYDRGYGRDRGDVGYPMGYQPYARRAGYDAGFASRGGYNEPRQPGWYRRYDRDWY